MTSPWQVVTHRVSLAGRVTDAHTARPIPGALVRLTRDDKSTTSKSALDGLFYFLDLKRGTYVLSVSLPSMGKRYSKVIREVAISHSPEDMDAKASLPSFITVPLQPCVIQGKISDKAQSPVVMAEVTMKGSGERCFSDMEGSYSLIGVEPVQPGGNRTVQVFAKGYKTLVKAAEINPEGTTFQPLVFELERSNGKPAGKSKVRE